MSTVTLRIQQHGYVRATGYQATQWAVTEPVAVPAGSTPRATDPSSYAPMFVIDTTGPVELLRRLARLIDFTALPRAELAVFDVRGDNAANLFNNALPGDKLWVSPTPAHWVQDEAPYDDGVFVIDAVFNRAQGINPQVLPGRLLTLPGYHFTPEDVGRWVQLDGFTTGSYNGFAQIVSYTGNVARISKATTTTETGSTWNFPALRLRPSVGAGLEPKFFPTREVNLPWKLYRGNPFATFPIATGTGGASMRELAGDLVRSVRFTELSPSLEDANALFEYVRAALGPLQDVAAVDGAEFQGLVTVTEGP